MTIIKFPSKKPTSVFPIGTPTHPGNKEDTVNEKVKWDEWLTRFNKPWYSPKGKGVLWWPLLVLFWLFILILAPVLLIAWLFVSCFRDPDSMYDYDTEKNEDEDTTIDGYKHVPGDVGEESKPRCDLPPK